MTVYRSGGITPLVLNFGTRWRLLITLKHQPLYFKKRTSVSLPIGRVEPRSGLDVLRSLAHAQIRTSDRPDRSLVTTLDTLPIYIYIYIYIYIIFFSFFRGCNVHLDITNVFFISPTDALYICLVVH